MEPVIFRLLVEGTESQERGIETLIKYLNKSLIQIKNKTTPTGFDKLSSIIWKNVVKALKELVQTNIDVRQKHIS